MFAAAYLNNKSTYGSGWDGTSFSAPIVAGAAALYLNKYPNKTNADFEKDLYASCTPLSDKIHSGHGKIDIGKLLNITDEKVNINFEASSWWNMDNAKTYCYIWDSKTKNELESFPGVLYKDNLEVNISKYDTVIFSRGGDNKEDYNARTINLNLSLFKYIDTYSIKNTNPTWYSESGPIVGKIH